MLHEPSALLSVFPFRKTLTRARSEEHTSELHHMSISYAVFCLKKKKKNKIIRVVISKHNLLNSISLHPHPVALHPFDASSSYTFASPPLAPVAHSYINLCCHICL